MSELIIRYRSDIDSLVAHGFSFDLSVRIVFLTYQEMGITL